MHRDSKQILNRVQTRTAVARGSLFVIVLLAHVLGLPGGTGAQQADSVRKVDPRARVVTHDKSAFAADPSYGELAYDYKAQLEIYGGKYMNRTQRPLLELGRRLYPDGPFAPAATPVGSHNILLPQLLVYGDFRTAAGYANTGSEVGTWASRINLDFDLKLTATERVHAVFRPTEKDGQITRYNFAGGSKGFEEELDAQPAALFFEGDLGAIVGGLVGRDSPFDLPIAAGLMPLLFHNGIWLDDAFTGLAFTLPARHSVALDWSNYDLSFFAGLDRVSTGAGALEENARIFGMNAFIEAYRGYVEGGYAYVTDKAADRTFHSVGLSFTRRYRGRISNSIRYIGAFGSKPGGEVTPDGHVLLIENSMITSRPSSVVPYLNLFVGLDLPASAARDPLAGGILKNTGLNFEPDAITLFPALDASARDALGGALGLNLLGSDLNRQLVIEFGVTYPHKASESLPGEQYAAGVRVQQPLTNAIILRFDGVYGRRRTLSDIRGVRLELRHKF